jgi:hypothetical protein
VGLFLRARDLSKRPHPTFPEDGEG